MSRPVIQQREDDNDLALRNSSLNVSLAYGITVPDAMDPKPMNSIKRKLEEGNADANPPAEKQETQGRRTKRRRKGPQIITNLPIDILYDVRTQ